MLATLSCTRLTSACTPTHIQVWFVSPEFPQPTKRFTLEQHARYMKELIAQMQPKVRGL